MLPKTIVFWLVWLVPAVSCGQAPRDFPAGWAARAELPTARVVDYDFKNIALDDVEAWLAWVGVESPVDVSGEVSGWLWAQRSQQGWFNFSDYRIEGELTSPRLTLENWTVGTAAVRFGYAKGVWYVGQLSGEITPPGGQKVAGKLSSYADLNTASPAELNLAGTLDHIDISTLLRSFEVPITLENRQGRLQFKMATPLGTAQDLASWNVTTRLQIDDVALPQLRSPVQIAAELVLENARWRLSKGSAALPEDQMLFSGNGSLQGTQDYQFAVSGQGISLPRLLAEVLDEPLPIALRGELNGQAELRGSVVGGMETATANIGSPQIEFGKFSGLDIELASRLSEDKLVVELRGARVAGGQLVGNAIWPMEDILAAQLPTEVSLSARNVELEQLLLLEGPPTRGSLDVDIAWLAAQQPQGPRDWQATIETRVRQAVVFGAALGNLKLSVNKPLGQPSAEALLALDRDAGSVRARLELELATADNGLIANTQLTQYRATGRMEDYAIVVEPPNFQESVPVSLTGGFEVTGSPQEWLDKGQASIDDASARIFENVVQLHALEAEFNADEFRLRSFTLSDLHGQVSGAGMLQRKQAGSHLLRLRVRGVEVGPYWDNIVPNVSHGLAGQVNLSTEIQADAAKGFGLADWNGTFQGGITQARFQGVELGEIHMHGVLNEQQTTVEIDGDIMGSRVSGSAQAPPLRIDALLDQPAHPETWPIQFTGTVEGLQLRRLSALLLGRRRAQAIEGTASLSVTGQLENRKLRMDGQLRVPKFFHNQQPLCRDLIAKLKVDEGRVRIEQARGMISGGRVELTGDYSFADSSARPAGGQFVFAVEGAEAQALVGLVYPALSDEFAGKISYRGRGRIGRTLTMHGTAAATHGLVFGMPLDALRSSLDVVLSTQGELLEISASDLTGTVLGGRFEGQARVRGGASYGLKASGRLDRGKLEQLSHALGFEDVVGRGIFDAKFNLDSRQAFELGALQGRVQFEFKSGDAQSVPILSDLNRIVPLMQLASTDIKGGSLIALIGQGQLRIQNMLLDSEAFWIAASGSASLTTGRMDLEGVLQTGGGLQAQVSQAGTKRLASVIAPELFFIAELDNLLRNRTLYFRVGGTTSHPVIQPKAAPTLARVFLQRIRREMLVAPTTAAENLGN